ncbi:hypothetical protein [Streptomyces sparsogenes]|uniref:Uncharacterized protein n=1 Tax=Streptomyces sparsogenes DSM 40356 TaxID=1331668 RepID=A0A1R1SBA1_9ACTN|nr:hypothetical protein [Streptomyces sparsogenes]OMI35563.1 hypothetical protein SPAR_30661 [Streptomyces sparsogenes DSM 40356]
MSRAADGRTRTRHRHAQYDGEGGARDGDGQGLPEQAEQFRYGWETLLLSAISGCLLLSPGCGAPWPAPGHPPTR